MVVQPVFLWLSRRLHTEQGSMDDGELNMYVLLY